MDIGEYVSMLSRPDGSMSTHAAAIPGYDLQGKVFQDASRAVPLARYGIPLDVAKMAAFLCSDNADLLRARVCQWMAERPRSCRS